MKLDILRRRPLLLLGLLLVLAVAVKNAWVCDDAYINFRSLDQLRAGHGPIWNPHERVQVYTSVLWFWLQAPLRLVSAHVYANVLVLSLGCLVGCLAVLRRLVPGDRSWLLLALLLVGARGFMDYTSSGLENPLVFVVCGLLLSRFVAVMVTAPGAPQAARPLRQFLWLAGMSLLVRHDLALLWLPPVLQAAWRHRRLWSPREWSRVMAIAAAPLVVWSLFAVFYYGSPWPNPALAKLSLGLDREVLVSQGLAYLSTTRHDLVLALVIVAGTAAALVGKTTRGLGLGILLHLCYLVWIGGDFMLGRMLGGVFLVAAVVVVRAMAHRGRILAWSAIGLSALAAMALPLTPLNSSRTLTNSTVNQRVVDERAYYFPATSLWIRLCTPAEAFPVHPWADDGRNAAGRDQTVTGAYNVGFFGYLAGLDKIVVDRYAITDPLLARIPPTRVADDWRPGHIKRDMPDGYGRSLQYGTNDVRGGGLHGLYEDVLLATSAPLLARGRAGAIWRLNVGSDRGR